MVVTLAVVCEEVDVIISVVVRSGVVVSSPVVDASNVVVVSSLVVEIVVDLSVDVSAGEVVETRCVVGDCVVVS